MISPYVNIVILLILLSVSMVKIVSTRHVGVRLHRRMAEIWRIDDNDDMVQAAMKKHLERMRKRPNIKVNEKLTKFGSASYTNCMVVRLISENNFYIAVRDKLVKGFHRFSLKSGEGFFELQTFGPSIVRLQDTKSGKYLSMTKRGDVTVMKKKYDKDTLFREVLEENNYYTLASHHYYIDAKHDFFIYVNKNGKVLPGWRPKPGKTRNFQILPDNDQDCKRR